MAQNPFKTPEFLRLLEKWNATLDDEGLGEINDYHSFKWTSPKECSHNVLPSQVPEIVSYFEMASELLNTFPFRNESHRDVWALHCEGYSIRRIAHTLNRKKTSVHTIILAIGIESGLRRG